MEEAAVLKDLATKLRIHSVQMTTASKSGHPTTCSSMAEIISVLFYKVTPHFIRHHLYIVPPYNVISNRR